MKRTSLFLLFCFVTLFVVAQRVEGSFVNQPLIEVLDMLSAQQEKHTVSYVHNQLEGITVTAHIKKKPLLQAIEEVCKEFPLRVKQKGNVILVQARLPFGVANKGAQQLSPLNLRAADTVDLNEMTDTMRLIALKEVTIEADRIIHRGDHDVLYLSKENRIFGTNALDAVSSLIFFQTSLNDTRLLSWDKREVFVLINGVPSTAIDLRGYKGEDIKSVEFYSIAPPQYMGFTEGPIANVIVKKRNDSQYSGYINTSNAANTGFGTDHVDLTYADSLNQVKLGYFIDYRSIKEISSQADFMYSPKHRSRYRGRGYYGGDYQNLYTSYQRYQGKHLFNAKLYSIVDRRRDKESRLSQIRYDSVNYQGNTIDQLKSQSRATTLDLYYRCRFERGRVFAINVVNALGNSRSNSSYEATFITNATNSGTLYGYQTDIANLSYSLITNAMYIAPLWGGTFNAAMRYEYNQLNQYSGSSRYTPHSHHELASAGSSWRWRYGYVVPTIGVNLFQNVSKGIAHTSVLPYFRFYSDWWGTGQFKGTSVQLTLTSNQHSPSLGELTESKSLLDPWTVAIGNSDLNAYWVNTGNLALCYFAPNGKNSVNFQVTPSYAQNKIATTVRQSGGVVYFQPQHIGSELGCTLQFYSNWSPLSWLSLSSYWEYYFLRYHTPSQYVRFNYMRVGGCVTMSYNGMSMVLAINSPTKVYDGDLLTRGSLQYAGTLQYKWKDWSFGAKYNYTGYNDYTIAELPDFKYYKNRNWRPLHHLTCVTVTYTFSVGRARKHDNKIINESSDNTGLKKFDKPKMAQ